MRAPLAGSGCTDHALGNKIIVVHLGVLNVARVVKVEGADFANFGMMYR